MVGNGDFQCFNSFLTATFYFVMLTKLVLHIRNIFFCFFLIVMDDKGNLTFVFLIFIILWNRKSWLDNFMLLVTLVC